MKSYETPGVFVKEVGFGESSIDGVDTSVAGFAVVAEAELEEPLGVESGAELTAALGPLAAGSTLGEHAARAFFDNGGRRLYVARIAGASAGGEGFDRALAALAAIDEISILAAPDAVGPSLESEARSAIQRKLVEQSERRRDRLAILDLPLGQTDVGAVYPPVQSSYAAVYHPWLETTGADGGTRLVPPSGAVAGLYARSDEEKGVDESPVGRLLGVSGVAIDLREEDQTLLAERGVNPVRRFPNSEIRVWGARTASSDPEWKYVAVRRYAMFLESSIHRGTQWVVFEPNDEPLRVQLRRTIEAFLFAQWRDGALQGQRPEAAYFVKVDSTTTTQADLDQGRVGAVVGFAPLRPAEFVILRLSWQTRREPVV